MKKVLCCILAFCTVGALTGCKKYEPETLCELSYNTKYICLNDLIEEDGQRTSKYYRYYIFYKNGTVDYHYYYRYSQESKISAYTIHFRYAIVEEQDMVFAFYNGHTYDETDESKSTPSNTTTRQFMYTEKFIMTTGGDMYVTQAFIDSLPNFGK